MRGPADRKIKNKSNESGETKQKERKYEQKARNEARE